MEALGYEARKLYELEQFVLTAEVRLNCWIGRVSCEETYCESRRKSGKLLKWQFTLQNSNGIEEIQCNKLSTVASKLIWIEEFYFLGYEYNVV
jgi:hypothetical protein